ncbi:alpha-L-fucosidase [Schaalia suimastitidis]|uniref:alpha-L-fucosidase n=1 Tax=Schaalia suimastitidis TaxID=121163 RepID=UPI0006845FDE|nr:alpha-L-fucosidase [Schaalia suimastitidis]
MSPALADPPSAPTTDETVTGIPAVVPRSDDPRIAAWQDLQFGLFMHWGVYSLYEGRYNGRDQVRGYPEQIKAWMRIPRDRYLRDAAAMQASQWDAAQVCASAKAAGMKYVMITSKHHDGFAMWDTKTTDYNIVDATAFGRDPLKELEVECGKIGMKLAFYFSIIDWEKHAAEPNANLNPISDEHHQYNLAQIDELMTNYGPIAEFWFDMGAPTPAQSQELAERVRQHQPTTTVVNSRVWNEKGDFEVGGDNVVPKTFRLGPWESILSIFPDCWSYCSTSKADRSEDNKAAKVREAVDGLVTVISGGGNYAYNIGPKGDGSIHPFDQHVLSEIAAWRQRHPDAIDGARATWFPIPQWGRITTKGNALYLFPNKWSAGSILSLPGLASKVTGVTIDGTDTALEYEHDGGTLRVVLAGEAPDAVKPVIKVQLDGPAMMLPTTVVDVANGTATIGHDQITALRNAQGSDTAALDAYIVNRSDTTFADLSLTLTANSGLSSPTLYKVTVGDTTVVASGAEIAAGPIGGFALAAHAAARIRIELATPTYYASPMPLTLRSIGVQATQNAPQTSVPQFSAQPASASARVEQTVTFSAIATGSPKPTYQWYRQIAGGERQAIEGATHAVYSFVASTADANVSFSVDAINSAGRVTSDSALLTVLPASQSIALGKPTSQSTTANGYMSSRAVDGITDGVGENGSVAATTSTTFNSWWEVDLEAPRTITAIDLWNRHHDDQCGSRTCASNMANVYVLLSKKPIDGNMFLNELIASPDITSHKITEEIGYPTRVEFNSVQARYIRIYLERRGRQLGLAEVEVFDKPLSQAPTVGAITATGTPEESFVTSGDGQHRTVTGLPGTQVMLEAPITGTPAPTLQWQRADSEGGAWRAIDEAQADRYTFTLSDADDGAQVRLVASNDAGSAASQTVSLRVNQAPTLVGPELLDVEGEVAYQDPDVDSDIRQLKAASGAQFTLAAEAQGRPTPALRWQYRVAEDTDAAWIDITEASGSTMTLTATGEWNGRHLRVVARNSVGETVSPTVAITVTSNDEPGTDDPQEQPPSGGDDSGTPSQPGSGDDNPGEPGEPGDKDDNLDTPGDSGGSETPGETPGTGGEDPSTGNGTDGSENDPDTPHDTQVEVSTPQVALGGTVTFSAANFVPGELVTFTVHSTPRVIGTATADQTGRATLTWTVPVEMELGAHRIVMSSAHHETSGTFTIVATGSQAGGTTPSDGSQGVGTSTSKESTGTTKVAAPTRLTQGTSALAKTGSDAALLISASAVIALAGIALNLRRRHG